MNNEWSRGKYVGAVSDTWVPHQVFSHKNRGIRQDISPGRYGKKGNGQKTAARIGEKCVPEVMREMRESQYHYSNCGIGPAEVIPALLSKHRRGLQLHALLAELTSNDHKVEGA
ncbi:hypothetical protein HA38_08165 [Pantoea allii]|nr:hypothetical protein HA38_08165 [Pantoea allii]PBJ99541.1 hypothetical protein CMR03_14430 [Pantoea allii]